MYNDEAIFRADRTYDLPDPFRATRAIQERGQEKRLASVFRSPNIVLSLPAVASSPSPCKSKSCVWGVVTKAWMDMQRLSVPGQIQTQLREMLASQTK